MASLWAEMACLNTPKDRPHIKAARLLLHRQRRCNRCSHLSPPILDTLRPWLGEIGGSDSDSLREFHATSLAPTAGLLRVMLSL
jgi:hypothetical protein